MLKMKLGKLGKLGNCNTKWPLLMWTAGHSKRNVLERLNG